MDNLLSSQFLLDIATSSTDLRHNCLNDENLQLHVQVVNNM